MLSILLAALTAPLALGAVIRGSVDYYNPTANGGSWLNNANDGYGEPLNVGASSFAFVPCTV